jgi:hypothetical protein
MLSLEAQINVDADAAANLYQETRGASRHKAPRITGVGAHLLLKDKTVTYNYVKTLHNAYAYPCLLTYIGIHNKWSQATLSTINWLSLGRASN